MFPEALKRVPAWLALVWLAMTLAWTGPVGGQDAAADRGSAAAEKTPAKKAKKFRGRLPNYYRQVVDEKQREAIYKIQQEYAPKIAALAELIRTGDKSTFNEYEAMIGPVPVE